MAEISQAAEDLFFKLRNRFPKIGMGDENGTKTINPEEARFFNFRYKDKKSGRHYGEVTCSIISGDALKVIFDSAITETMLPEDIPYWYSFLKELRRLAKRHMLNFDVRDITKDYLSKQDFDFMKMQNPEKKKMKESLEESKVLWNRRGKVSEGNLNNVRIHVVHNEKMMENPHNRLLKVDRIFLVNESGEKFLLPFKSVSGAKAMANHVSRGGNPYDAQGQLIGRAVNEMRNLGRFIRTTNNKTFEAAEAGNVIKSAQQMRESIKRHLGRLSNNSRNFNESLEELANLISESPEDITEVKGWFTQQTYNENLDNYLASAAGAYKKLKENAMSNMVEAAGAVEQKILDPNFKLVLKADPAMDKLMVSRDYRDTIAMLSAILGDISNRLVSKDGDDIANFASLMGDLISSEGEAFGKKSDDEYARDKKLAIMLAQKYMKDLHQVLKSPDYASQVRVSNKTREESVELRTEADDFAESIMSIGKEKVKETDEQPGWLKPAEVEEDSESTLSRVARAALSGAAPVIASASPLAGAMMAASSTPANAGEPDYVAQNVAAQKAKDAEGVKEADVPLPPERPAALGGKHPMPPARPKDEPQVSEPTGKPATPSFDDLAGDLWNAVKTDVKDMWNGTKTPQNTLPPGNYPGHTVEEDDVEEGNEFSGALAKARASGANSFEVDGKTYQVKEDDVSEDDVEEGNEFSGALADARKRGDDSFEVDGKEYKVHESINSLRKLAGLEYLSEYTVTEAPPKNMGGTVTKANAPAASKNFQGTIKDFQRLNTGATVGQAMNAIQGKTAIPGGANDPKVIQQKLNANPPPGKSPEQAFDPAVPRAGSSAPAGVSPADRAQAFVKPGDASFNKNKPETGGAAPTTPLPTPEPPKFKPELGQGTTVPYTPPQPAPGIDAGSGVVDQSGPVSVTPTAKSLAEPSAPATGAKPNLGAGEQPIRNLAPPSTPPAPKAAEPKPAEKIPDELMSPKASGPAQTFGNWSNESIDRLSKLAGLK